MSEHERVSRGHAGSTTTSSSQRIELTPAQRIDEAIDLAGNSLSQVEATLVAVQRATKENDLRTWSEKRRVLDTELATTERLVQRLVKSGEIEPSRLAEVNTRYAIALTTAGAHAVAPRGYVPVSIEAELLAAVAARPEGYKVGLDRKEQALRALLDRLDLAESRMLVARISKPVPEDELAAAFRKPSNLGSERLARLLSFAKDAPRRAAVRAEVEHSLGAAANDAEIEDSLGPEPKKPLVDGFDKSVAKVSEAYDFPKQREEVLPSHEDAAKYLHINNLIAFDDLRAYLADVSWPDLVEGMVWRSEPAFSEHLVRSLRKSMPGLGAHAVNDLLYPHDLFAIIDTLRPDKGHLAWVPAIGVALGQLVQRVGATALRRVGSRMIAAADERGELDPSRVSVSHPMDGHVLAALRDPDVATVLRGTGKARRHRPIKLAFQGKDDPSLWRWVRAEPADATAEEVVEQLASDYGGDWFADALAAAPPMFGLPAAWARTIPAAAKYMPGNLTSRQLDLRIDTPDEQLIALAGHAQGELAAHESADPSLLALPVSASELADVLVDCTIQLAAIRKTLSGWGVDELATDALLRVVTKQEQLSSGALDIAAWGPIAVGQRKRLHAIGDALNQLDAHVGGLGDRRGESLAPVRRVVRHLGGAVAASHIASASDALFERALRAQSDLSVDSIQAQILDVEAASDAVKSSHDTKGPAANNVTGDRLTREGATQVSDARVMQDRLINGRDVTSEELGDVTLATQETAMRSRLNALFVQSGQLQVAAAEAGAGPMGKIAAIASARFGDLGGVMRRIRLHVDRVNAEWTVALHPDQTTEVRDASKRRAALAIAEDSYAKIREDRELMQFIEDGQALIEAQQFRKTCVTLVALIAVGVVATTAAGAVAESVGAAFMSAEGAAVVGEVSTLARNITAIAGFGTEVGINAVGTAALTETTLKSAILENMLFAAGGRALASAAADIAEARAVVRSFEREAALAGIVEGKIARMVGTGLKSLGWAALKTAQISAETILNMALASLAAKLQSHPDATPQDARDWLMQALSVAAGRAVHAALGDRMPSLERLTKRTDATAAEKRLLADFHDLDRLALAVEHAGSADAAVKILAERTRLLERELGLVELRARWSSSPEARAEHDAHHQELTAQLENVSDEARVAIRMSLNGLEELVTGQTWRGTPEEIQRVAHELNAGQTYDAARRVTTLNVGGKTIEVYERPRPHEQAATPRATHELGTELETVPGSALRGAKPSSAAPSEAAQKAVLAAALDVMPQVAVAADVNDIHALGDRRFVVTLRDGTKTIFEVAVARIEDHDVARLLPNSSRETPVDGHIVRGEHVIQLSAHLSGDQVERALAHAVARLTTVHERAQRGAFGDGPRDNGGRLVGLSADATGRVAELRVLVRQLQAHPDNALAIRREILALADHLAVVGRDPETLARREHIEEALTVREREELDRAASADGSGKLEEVREAARRDIEADLGRENQRGNDRPRQYDLAPGNRMSRADLARYATAAARLRSLESHRTLQRLRAETAKLGPGQHLRIEDVQLGGGLSLAGRTPTSLLVDLRGRWQADGSVDIAQTAQQLSELYKARFGETRQVAGPNERVPLEAIRFWEDSIAAMGPVIDGAGALRIEGSTLLLDITPTDGSPVLTIEVGGTPTVATGFVPEAVPGAPRTSMVDVVTTLDARLTALASSTSVDHVVHEAAQIALLRLRAIERPRATDAAIADALAGPHVGRLKAALVEFDTSPDIATQTKTAIAVAEGGERWAELKSRDAEDGIEQVAFGDEANLEWRVDKLLSQLEAKLQPSTQKPIRVVMAGAGGTAVSAAEIILARPKTSVTMLGRMDTPAGLLKNNQFMKLARLHADPELAASLKIAPGSGRLKMHLKADFSAEIPVVRSNPDGTQAFEAYPAREGRPDEFVGDAYVVSAGRKEETPPVVSDLILQAKRSNATIDYFADFDADGQYTGYTVRMTASDRTVREVKVTGAASRYAPRPDVQLRGTREPAGERIRKSSGNDAPDATGTFAGGAAGSGVQSYRHAARDNQEAPQKKDHGNAAE